MINLSVDSHGNHPGSRQKERGRSLKACESDSEQIHKDDCSQGDFCLIKKGIVFWYNSPRLVPIRSSIFQIYSL